MNPLQTDFEKIIYTKFSNVYVGRFFVTLYKCICADDQ